MSLSALCALKSSITKAVLLKGLQNTLYILLRKRKAFSATLSLSKRNIIYTHTLYWQTEVRNGCSTGVLESKRSWTSERETRVAVNQVDKKESAHLLVILQGSSVHLYQPSYSLFTTGNWKQNIPIFLTFLREFTWIGTFKIVPKWWGLQTKKFTTWKATKGVSYWSAGLLGTPKK